MNYWQEWVFWFVLVLQFVVYVTYIGYCMLIVYLNRRYPEWFRKRAISIDRSVKMRPRLKDVLKNLIINVTCINIFLTPLAMYISPNNLPVSTYNEISWAQVIDKLLICIAFTDTWFYHIHRLLHLPELYRRYHYVHHEASQPYSWTTNYSHIVELLGLNTPTVFGGPLITKMSFALSCFWLIFITVYTVTHHTGYELVWFIDTKHHDMHHALLKSKYGLTKFWDRFWGTNGEAKSAFSVTDIIVCMIYGYVTVRLVLLLV